MRAGIFLQASAFAIAAHIGAGAALAQTPALIYADQGPNWSDQTRQAFYTTDQGSKMIPLAWLKALKKPNGGAYLPDGLSAYGYLPNPGGPNGLPVGFTAAGIGADQTVGMTCSACHTRQISVGGQPVRIDGGPAVADFQSLLTDIDKSVGAVLASDDAFKPFAAAALGEASPAPNKILTLRIAVANWYQRYHTLMSLALPATPWGPSRLDAVGMIFNRLTGLDIGKEADNFIIPGNIQRADAPVRYPFLWNAAIQDKTQWPGFAENGSNLLGLARNTGEVFGVFGTFQPRKFGPLPVDFLHNNSVNFDGLHKLEDLIKQIGPPKWQWELKPDLVSKGEAIFNRSMADGGCAGCHAIKPGKVQFPLQQTWATCVMNVGTDDREYNILGFKVDTGVLNGVGIPVITKKLQPADTAFNVLTVSVIGSIIDNFFRGKSLDERLKSDAKAIFDDLLPTNIPDSLPDELQDLSKAFHDLDPMLRGEVTASLTTDCYNDKPPKGAYEARVMQGIWAAAPYLHNGSVPTLRDLLKPWDKRPASFKIGPGYDLASVGLAVEQTAFDYTLKTTGCEDIHSGASRCGHNYGLTLKDDEKEQLLEYLKQL